MSKSKKVGIIGSGIAGLAAALRIAAKGHAVTVFEKEAELGGKMGQIQKDNYRFDTGPSLFTQPYLVDELLSLIDTTNNFEYQKMEISCKYFWEDGTVFSAYENKEALRKELKKVFPAEESRFMERLEKAREMYDLVGEIFIEKPLNKWSTWLHKDVAKALLHLPKFKLNSNMHNANENYFKDPKVSQIFDRFATYNGSNPYKAPALLNMIPHLEFNLGTYYPKGGLRSLPDTLIQLGKKLGVSYKTNEPVEEILVDKNKAVGIRSIKDTYKFDAVVSNADVYPTYKRLLKKVKAPEKVLSQERSSSGIIFYWGIKKEFPQLDLHNIFFSDSYQKEFNAIFKDQTVGEDPTVYVNISSKVDESDAPPGGENWFVLINAPANNGQDWDKLIASVRTNVIKKLERILKEKIEDFIEFEEVLDPRSIERKTSSYQGSLYGTSSNGKFAAFFRHTNDHKTLDNLYFCGGSVHPGGGIPLCLNSAKIVSNLI
jgi:phytoene desaturase